MTPKYDSAKPVQRNPLYYHPTPDSWFADVDYPNPKSSKSSKSENSERRKRQPKRKTVIRFGKMRSWEWSLIQMGGLLLLLKWIIFGF